MISAHVQQFSADPAGNDPSKHQPKLHAPALEFIVGHTWIAEPTKGVYIAESCRWGLQKRFIFSHVERFDAGGSEVIARGFFGRDARSGVLMSYSFGTDGTFNIGHRMQPGNAPGTFQFHLHTYGPLRMHRRITMAHENGALKVQTEFLSSDAPGALPPPSTVVYRRNQLGTRPG